MTMPAFDDSTADKNAQQIRDALLALKHQSEKSLLATPDFKKCFELAGELRGMLRDLRPIRASDRTSITAELNDICARLKHEQDELWTKRRIDSEQVRGHFVSDIRDVGFSIEGAEAREDIIKCDEQLTAIRERLADRHPFAPSCKLLREDRDTCWERFREATKALGFRRQRLQDLDYSRLSGPIADVKADAGREDPFTVFARIKELQAELRTAYLSKLHRDELKGGLQAAWEEASARADARREERKRRHEEHLERKQKRRQKLEETAQMFEEMIERKETIVERFEANIEKNRSREIWNDDFQAKVDEWVSEDEGKIASIKEDIRDIQVKLSDIRSQLSEMDGDD